MGLNSTPRGQRVHIGIFGRRNVGKSSLINALTGQNIAIVSDIKGTTTDPIVKAMELLPIGAVVFIDTAGIDDSSDLGQLRVQKTYQVLSKTDIALLVLEYGTPQTDKDLALIEKFKEKSIPYLIVINKTDGIVPLPTRDDTIYVSCKQLKNIDLLKQKLARLIKSPAAKPIASDLAKTGQTVILVTPIDESAPKGRLILPQQQTIRDLIDNHIIVMTVQPEELAYAINLLNTPPALVITDSQALKQVAEITPTEIPLTAFSILFARYKGMLENSLKGISQLSQLKGEDNILISEGCTHHKQCGDIGSVKIPNWIKDYTGKDFNYSFTSGGDFPNDLTEYKLIIHCGGCTLNEKELLNRIQRANAWGIPMTNYGILISLVQGTLKRTLLPFPNLYETLK